MRASLARTRFWITSGIVPEYVRSPVTTSAPKARMIGNTRFGTHSSRGL